MITDRYAPESDPPIEWTCCDDNPECCPESICPGCRSLGRNAEDFRAIVRAGGKRHVRWDD